MNTINRSFLSVTMATLFACLLLVQTSCKKDRGDDGLPPTITAVTDLINRNITLTAVNYGDWIIIKGNHLATTYKVDFNGVLASDSLRYADDTTVTVKIPPTLPDPANNPITVTTKYGSATYNFRILQPPPVITSVDPGAGNTDDVITINGDYFSGLSEVRFESTVATVVSNTKTEIKVKVPAGATYGYIYVTTASGVAKSPKIFGFKYVIYDDALAATWYGSSFSSTTTYSNTAGPIKRGANAIKQAYTTAWGAFRTSKNTPALTLTGYTGIKFSIYAGAGSLNKKIKIYLNALSGSGYTFTITETGKWIDYEVPLFNLGNPTTLNAVVLQEFSGVVQGDVYIDDIGLY